MNNSHYPRPYQHHSRAPRPPMGQPNNRVTLEELKQQCPLPTLMEHLNLGDHAKPNCKSPFRRDEQGAWGIFQTNDGWRFKDHLTGDSGDEVTFLANLLNLDDRENFPPLMGVYRAVALRVGQSQSQHPAPRPAMIGEPSAEPMFPPDRTGFGPGTEAQRKQLALPFFFYRFSVACTFLIGTKSTLQSAAAR